MLWRTELALALVLTQPIIRCFWGGSRAIRSKNEDDRFYGAVSTAQRVATLPSVPGCTSAQVLPEHALAWPISVWALATGSGHRLHGDNTSKISRAALAKLASAVGEGVALCGAGEGRFFAHLDVGLYS